MMRTLLCPAVLLLSSAVASAQVYYATEAPSLDANWRLDVATGVSAGPVWTGGAATGLADDDAARVYYLCFGAQLSTAPYAGQGGPAALLGMTTYQGLPRSFTGLAAHGGVLYGSHNSGVEGLYAIDVVTLSATLAYTYTNQEIAVEGLDIDPATLVFYGANDGAAYVDPQAAWGRGVVIIDLQSFVPFEGLVHPYPTGVSDIDGLAFDPAGVVYLIEDEPSPLHNFDVATGTFDPNPPQNATTTVDIYSAGTYSDGTLPGLGSNYCTAVPNSTGAGARMSAVGSSAAAMNSVTLTASGLPNNAFGFFLTSRAQGSIQNPGGSQGTLCLSGAIGRYVGAGQIQNSQGTGAISLALDLTRTPTPTGLVTVQAGETWNFTAWFRDAVMGSATSNFADGLEIQFL